MIIKDTFAEKFGCVRFQEPQNYLPFNSCMVIVAFLSDGTKVAGLPKDFLKWKKALYHEKRV